MNAAQRVFVMVACGLAAVGSATLPAAATPADTELGGCFRGGVMTAERVPGTGSAGQSIRRTAEVWECSSPLLPGIVSGRFEAELPWRGDVVLTSGRFEWSDGSVSLVTGLPNTLWEIYSGPGSGHVLQFELAMAMNGNWYYSDNAMAIDSLGFVR
ncbi:hypothetical protein [Nocardia sp. NPDC127526]|uniref:hypothetical protein n=1 Tax=Nocardia sp. NPDC127526 TaxID=3345393 RepID=UPI003633302B